MRLGTILLLAISVNAFGQINQDELKQKVRTTANQMGQLFLTGDHNRFVDFMYPKAVAKIGGKERIVKTLTDGQAQMERDGVKFKNVEFDEPSDIFEKEKTLQCIIPQIITMKVRGGTLKSKASLFAISEDNGQSWTFLDVSKKTYEQVKSIIPVFHSGLEIPTWPDPTFTPDR